jgi:hypothetical protein
VLSLWAAGTLLWLVLVAAIEAPSIHAARQADRFAQSVGAGRAPVPALPVLCEAARGVRYIDYRLEPAVAGGPKYCWYAVADFRRLHPEYASVPDRDLYRATWAKTGQPVTAEAARARLAAEIRAAAMEAVAGPAVAGLLIIAVGWWLRGGGARGAARRRRRTEASMQKG